MQCNAGGCCGQLFTAHDAAVWRAAAIVHVKMGGLVAGRTNIDRDPAGGEPSSRRYDAVPIAKPEGLLAGRLKGAFGNHASDTREV